MSNIFNKKSALIDTINAIRESVSKEYADEHKAKAIAARNSGKMSDYHKHMSTHHDHLATHFTDKGDSRAADLHMNKATEHEAKAKEVSEAKLDSVKPHELKKDFKDRQDKDIDNDGKVDSSDEYLHKRRQAISQKMKSEGFSDEEIDGLLEYEMSRRADGKYVDDEGNVMSRPPSRWASKKVTSNMYNPSYRSKYRPSYGKPKNEEVEIEEEQIDELSIKKLKKYSAAANKDLDKNPFMDQKPFSRGSNKALNRETGIERAHKKIYGKPKNEEVEIEEAEQFAGWIAYHNDKKLEIRKHEAKDLYDAKQKAIAHFKPKKSQKHMVSVKPAYEEVDYDIQEQSDREEKHEMAQTQAHFIKYAAEEILEYIEMGGEIEEWYQNKLAKVHSDMESLHSYMEGEKRRTGMAEEAVGTSAKYADKSSAFGGKYTSHDHIMTMKNASKVRDQRAKQKRDEHEKQDASMHKKGYAKHMVDLQKAEKKAAEKGADPSKTARSANLNRNGLTPNRKLPESVELEEASEISPKQNMLLRAMATDPQDINKMRRAIKLGDKALMNPVMRQEILRMLDQMMDVSLSDPTIFAKTRQIFKKRKATDTTNTE